MFAAAGPPLRGLLRDTACPSRTGTPPGPDGLQESESQIFMTVFMTEGSHRASAATSCRYRPCTHEKTPVPTAVPADIAEAQLPGSGATLLYYTPAGFRAKGHPGLTSPLDIRAATAYHRNIAPDTGGCTLEYRAQCRTGVFLLRSAPLRQRPSKGQEPAGAKFSHRDLSRRTGYPYVTFHY